MKIEEEFDIERMSEETGISIALIKETLNIPLETNCIAKTIFEAQKDFRNAIPDSENKLAAFKIWMSLITTTLDAQKAHESVPKDSIYEFLAYNTWHKLSIIEVENIKSLSDAQKAHNNAQPNTSAKLLAYIKIIEFTTTLVAARRLYNELPETSKAKPIVFHLWYTLSLREVNEAKNLEEMLQAFQNAPDNSEIKNLAIAKLTVFFERKPN